MEKILKPLLMSSVVGSAMALAALALLTSSGLLSLGSFEKIVFVIGAGIFSAVFRGFGSFEKDEILRE